ncbi:sigma-54 interaction domain-containing protein [Dinoroseobacter sp. S375]|uniref:sigma-54 interaction domain-containing protein n=1 Tax=Dinoroseobacter sp. S375 TaxID=3415136 RepID=UPI003C7B620B
MDGDSDFFISLHDHPFPAAVLDVRLQRLTAANAGADALFGTELARAGLDPFLNSPGTEFAVFLEAVEHFGAYIGTALSFVNAAGDALRLQLHGSALSNRQILLSFLDLDAQARRNERAELEAQHRAGLTQWQNIYGFFREIEAQNQLILDAAGEGIYGIDAEGRATFVNRAAQDMLGWQAKDLIGKELHSIIHHHHLNGEHFPAHTCPIYDSFRRDRTVRIEDDAFWRKDGKPIFVEYVSTPIYDHGVLAGAVVIFRDITERKENEARLRTALAEVETLREQLEQENDYLLTEIRNVRSHAGIVGEAPSTKALNTQIGLAAETKANALVSGPPGAGKSLTVTAIHEASDRAKRPLVRVNCSDVSARELEIDLFGIRRGSARGVTRDIVGKLALANHATLHLIEVSDMPKELQAKLVTVLTEKRVRRIGDSTDIPVDLVVIATTARDLAAEVKAGRFRQDLFFELSVFPITCPPLRDRREDIPHLAKHFIDRAVKRLRVPPVRLTKGNIDALLAYDWPGNVREFESVIERSLILAQGGKLRFDFEIGEAPASNGDETILTDADLRRMERENLVRCLRRAKGKVSGLGGAARLLDLAPTTVYSRIKSLKIADEEWQQGG